MSKRPPSRRSGGDLRSIADRINREHDACENAFGEAVAHAIEAGRLLVEAKGLVPHGGWLGWLKDNCRFSERTAQGYMRVAKLGGENPQRVAGLSLRDALAELADRSPQAMAIEPPDDQHFGPLTPEEKEERDRCEEVLRDAGRRSLEAGRAMLKVYALLGPERFGPWLDQTYPDDDDRVMLLRLMEAARSPDATPESAFAASFPGDDDPE